MELRFCKLLILVLLSGCATLSNTAPRLSEDEGNDSTSKLKELAEFEESREKDRENLQKKSASGAIGTVPKTGELFEGDIIMDNDLRLAVLGEADKRSVLKKKDKLWPDKTVPFVLDPKLRYESKVCILRAMRSFHRHTCIKFVKRTDEEDYIYVTSRKNMCASFVGRRGGRQPVTIGRGCTRLGTCEHELLHALGTIHEQSRPDRDAHVRIIWDNIKASERHNFNKYSYKIADDEGLSYDFMSVMHYPNHAFAKDRSIPTIVSKSDPDLVFGQRRMFTNGDVEAINRLYKCHHDKHAKDLPQVLSDDEVRAQRERRERFDFDF